MSELRGRNSKLQEQVQKKTKQLEDILSEDKNRLSIHANGAQPLDRPSIMKKRAQGLQQANEAQHRAASVSMKHSSLEKMGNLDKIKD